VAQRKYFVDPIHIFSNISVKNTSVIGAKKKIRVNYLKVNTKVNNISDKILKAKEISTAKSRVGVIGHQVNNRADSEKNRNFISANQENNVRKSISFVVTNWKQRTNVGNKDSAGALMAGSNGHQLNNRYDHSEKNRNFVAGQKQKVKISDKISVAKARVGSHDIQHKVLLDSRQESVKKHISAREHSKIRKPVSFVLARRKQNDNSKISILDKMGTSSGVMAPIGSNVMSNRFKDKEDISIDSKKSSSATDDTDVSIDSKQSSSATDDTDVSIDSKKSSATDDTDVSIDSKKSSATDDTDISIDSKKSSSDVRDEETVEQPTSGDRTIILDPDDLRTKFTTVKKNSDSDVVTLIVHYPTEHKTETGLAGVLLLSVCMCCLWLCCKHFFCKK